jgi:hypothetical protein
MSRIRSPCPKILGPDLILFLKAVIVDLVTVFFLKLVVVNPEHAAAILFLKPIIIDPEHTTAILFLKPVIVDLATILFLKPIVVDVTSLVRPLLDAATGLQRR